ncbi:MAG: T9SS type A sorting domain-containing protein [Bacteroidia bacterium]
MPATLSDLNDFPSTQASWKLYPNPAKHASIIQDEVGRGLEPEIIGEAGRMVKRFSACEGRREYPLDLPAGVYMVRERRGGTVQRIVVVE